MSEKAKWMQYAIVSGQFTFPVDMLRYDCATPVNFTIEDEEKAVLNEGETKFLIRRGTRTKNQKWTEARWNSFSWNIKPLKPVKIT